MNLRNKLLIKTRTYVHDKIHYNVKHDLYGFIEKGIDYGLFNEGSFTGRVGVNIILAAPITDKCWSYEFDK